MTDPTLYASLANVRWIVNLELASLELERAPRGSTLPH